MREITCRKDVLLEIYDRIKELCKNNLGTSFGAPAIRESKPEFDFSVTDVNGKTRKIKLFTSQKFEGNTAISENTLKDTAIDYIGIYAHNNGLYVFRREDVENVANKMVKGDRKHCNTIVNNMPSDLKVQGAENLKRVFEGY